MAANGSGLQWSTVRSLALAWVLTLPAAIMMSGSLYGIFARSSDGLATRCVDLRTPPISAALTFVASQISLALNYPSLLSSWARRAGRETTKFRPLW